MKINNILGHLTDVSAKTGFGMGRAARPQIQKEIDARCAVMLFSLSFHAQFFFVKIKLNIFGIFLSYTYYYFLLKVSNCRGDLTYFLATIKTLVS